MKHVWLLLIAAAAVPAAQQREPPAESLELTQVTLEGCVQATGDPQVFLLAVPARFPDPDRGLATGEPVPRGGGLGPAPRRDPRTVPPVKPQDERGRPQGRYETRTTTHHSYRLHDVDAEQLGSLIGAQVKVQGDVRVEGFPSGDLTDTAERQGGPTIDRLYVRELTRTADRCSLPIE